MLENLPTFVAVPTAVATYRRFRFSDRAYAQATLFLVLHTVGSHFTYSEVPFGSWMRDLLGLSRNHYDRLVHFAFGLLLLRPVRELGFRRGPTPGTAAVLYFSVAGIACWSLVYEVVEWLVASVADPAAGTAYLGTQGDVWDAEKDMALAVSGAILAAAVEWVVDPPAPAPRRRAARATALVALALGGRLAAAGAPADVEVFTREGCARCAVARTFLEELERERPGLRVVVHDVERDPAALARLRALAARGDAPLGVPAFLVGDRLVVGFAGEETTGARLRALLGGPRDAPADGIPLPLIGVVSADRVGLPLFSVVLGLVDGFNPCATWVLLFVLSLLVNLRDRRRMLLVGGTFVLASGLAYYAFMAAWLNLFLLLGVSAAVEAVLGAVAVGIGALNAKDFVALGRGPSLGVPAAVKPRLYAQVRRVLHADHLPAALAAAAVLAILVNVVELVCTAGLPAVYTHVLTSRQLPAWQYHAYLALYDAAYVLDDAALLAVAVVTLRRWKLQERGGRWLKLVSGVVMLGLGVALLVDAGRRR